MNKIIILLISAFIICGSAKAQLIRFKADTINAIHSIKVKSIDRTSFFDKLSSVNEATTAAYGDSTITLQKLTQAAYNFIGSGGNVVNNPDDITLENKSGSTIGIKSDFLLDSLSVPDTIAIKLRNIAEGGVIHLKQLSFTNPYGGGRFVVRSKIDLITIVGDSIENGATLIEHPTSTLLFARQECIENKYYRPEWFGAIPNDTTQMSLAALQACFNALPKVPPGLNNEGKNKGGVIKLSGMYKVGDGGDTLKWNGGSLSLTSDFSPLAWGDAWDKYEWDYKNTAGFYCSGDSNVMLHIGPPAFLYYSVMVENLTFSGSSADSTSENTAIYIDGGRCNSTFVNLQFCWLLNGTAIKYTGSTITNIYDKLYAVNVKNFIVPDGDVNPSYSQMVKVTNCRYVYYGWDEPFTCFEFQRVGAIVSNCEFDTYGEGWIVIQKGGTLFMDNCYSELQGTPRANGIKIEAWEGSSGYGSRISNVMLQADTVLYITGSPAPYNIHVNNLFANADSKWLYADSNRVTFSNMGADALNVNMTTFKPTAFMVQGVTFPSMEIDSYTNYQIGEDAYFDSTVTIGGKFLQVLDTSDYRPTSALEGLVIGAFEHDSILIMDRYNNVSGYSDILFRADAYSFWTGANADFKVNNGTTPELRIDDDRIEIQKIKQVVTNTTLDSFKIIADTLKFYVGGNAYNAILGD